MRRIVTLLAASAAMLTAGACATQQHSEMSEASTLAKPTITNTPRESASVAELRGETASVYGDDETSVKLFERSVAERPTALNEFNLAAAYNRTGRPQLAIAMYRRAQGDGVNQTAIALSKVNGADIDVHFNISDEARLRIAGLEAASVPGAKDARGVSNAQAIRLDAATPPR